MHAKALVVNLLVVTAYLLLPLFVIAVAVLVPMPRRAHAHATKPRRH